MPPLLGCEPDDMAGDLEELNIHVDSALAVEEVKDNFRHLFPEPTTYDQATSRSDSRQWFEAMNKELDALMETKTWQVVDKVPVGREAIGCKWVFKIKVKADGLLDKYKARLVARGDSQKSGIDYKEVFAPVAQLATI